MIMIIVKKRRAIKPHVDTHEQVERAGWVVRAGSVGWGDARALGAGAGMWGCVSGARV